MEEEMMELTPEELAPCKELDDLTIVTIPEENQVPGKSQEHNQEHIIVPTPSLYNEAGFKVREAGTWYLHPRYTTKQVLKYGR